MSNEEINSINPESPEKPLEKDFSPPSPEEIIELLKKFGVSEEKAKRAFDKITRAFININEIMNPTRSDVEEKMAGVFTYINNALQQAGLQDQQEKVRNRILDIFTGKSTLEEKPTEKEAEASDSDQSTENKIDSQETDLSEKDAPADPFKHEVELEEPKSEPIKPKDEEKAPEEASEEINLKELAETSQSRLDLIRQNFDLVKKHIAEAKTIAEFEKFLKETGDHIKYIDQVQDPEAIEKILEELENWLNDIIKNINISDLPEEARKYLEGYADLDPGVIFASLTAEDMGKLKYYFENNHSVEAEDFLCDKIKSINLEHDDSIPHVPEEKLHEIMKSVVEILDNTVTMEARKNLMKMDTKKLGKVTWRIIKNYGLYATGGVAIGTLGFTTGGLGFAAGFSLLGLSLRKIEQAKKKRIAAEEAEKFNEQLAEEKKYVLSEMFADEDEVAGKLSAIISNEIRNQTSQEAIARLKEYEQATTTGDDQAIEKGLKGIEQALFKNALTVVKAENPHLSAEQHRHMAVIMAMTLAQHERSEHQAKKTIEDLKKNKPKVIQALDKFNAWRFGKLEDKPDGIQEDKWLEYKRGAAAMAIGTGVGMVVRHNIFARIGFGVAAGVGYGYTLSELNNSNQEQKIYNEIEELIEESREHTNQSENYTLHFKLPSPENFERLRENATIVEGRLQMGLLDKNEALKSRAENFIHLVRKLEMNREKVLIDLLKQQEENRQALEKSIEGDVKRIEKNIKKRRVIGMIGGGLAGGLFVGAVTEDGRDVVKNIFGEAHDVASGIIDKSHDLMGGVGDKFKNTEDVYKDNPESSQGHQVDVSQADQSVLDQIGIEKTNEVLENKISSSELGGGRHDSVWYSTYQMIKENSEKLGFKGKPENFEKWAETKTNLLLNQLDNKTTGGIKDLVHDGDYVFLKQEKGNWELGFRNDSGIKPDYLPEVRQAREIKLEDLTTGESTSDQMWHRELQSKINDLEQKQKSDLQMTEKAFAEGTINRDQFNESVNTINHRYEPQVDIYQKMLDSHQGQGNYEEVSKLLLEKDPVRSGEYQSLIGSADSPNQELVRFINQHQSLAYADIVALKNDHDLFNEKLGSSISLEKIYDLQRSGYEVRKLNPGEANAMFNVNSAIVLHRADKPEIFLNNKGEYGYEFKGELSKSGTINFGSLSAKYLNSIERQHQRLSYKN